MDTGQHDWLQYLPLDLPEIERPSAVQALLAPQRLSKTTLAWASRRSVQLLQLHLFSSINPLAMVALTWTMKLASLFEISLVAPRGIRK